MASTIALAPATSRRRRSRRYLQALGGLLTIYFLLAYALVPFGWRRWSARHAIAETAPRITRTGDGIPGDPLNVSVVGAEDDLKSALVAAGWRPADAITYRSCKRIVGAVLLHRPYEEAPISNLYLWSRCQDLAFQQPVGRDPRRRHHVRFWRADQQDDDGRPVWLAAATFDIRVGLSHTTGQVTHHINADVDRERDKLVDDLKATGQVEVIDWLPNFHKKLRGKNGGGDRYFTDGRLPVVVLASPRLAASASGRAE